MCVGLTYDSNVIVSGRLYIRIFNGFSAKIERYKVFKDLRYGNEIDKNDFKTDHRLRIKVSYFAGIYRIN